MLDLPELLLPKSTVSGARRTVPVSRQALKFSMRTSVSTSHSVCVGPPEAMFARPDTTTATIAPRHPTSIGCSTQTRMRVSGSVR